MASPKCFSKAIQSRQQKNRQNRYADDKRFYDGESRSGGADRPPRAGAAERRDMSGQDIAQRCSYPGRGAAVGRAPCVCDRPNAGTRLSDRAGRDLFQRQFFDRRTSRPIANELVNVLAAGRLALDGSPAAAYDWPLHKAAEVRAVGHDFANYYGWHYPPPFLFVAAALAILPYLAAAIAWLVATLGAYAATLGGILGGRAGVFLALGFRPPCGMRPRRTERLSHRSADRRCARPVGAPAGARRPLSRTAQLQAAIRICCSRSC